LDFHPGVVDREYERGVVVDDAGEANLRDRLLRVGKGNPQIDLAGGPMYRAVIVDPECRNRDAGKDVHLPRWIDQLDLDAAEGTHLVGVV